MPRVLVVVAPGAEEIETITPADILVRAGCEVVMAAADAAVTPGSRGLPLASHAALDEVLDQDFDLVFLPGGLGSADYCSQDPRIQQLIADRLEQQRLLAIICACPIALLPGGHADKRTLTCYPGKRTELEDGGATWLDSEVVIDGCLITSQGPGTAMALGLTLARLLVDADTADTVATAMLVDSSTHRVEVCS